MTYNLKGFLRKIPPDNFKEYLQQRFHSSDNDTILWGASKQKEFLSSLIDYIQNLNKNDQNILNFDCEIAYFITENHQGVQALNDALEYAEHQDLLKETETKAVKLSKALFIQLKNPKIMERALHYYQADRLYSGKKHSQYKLEGGFKYYTDKEHQDLFKEAVTKIIQKKDILAKVHIDWVERYINNKLIQQIVIYSENAPKGFPMFNEQSNELETKFLRLVSEACICFNPQTGKIDVMGEGGKDRHQVIRDKFQDIIIINSQTDKIKPITQREIILSKFKTKPDLKPYYGNIFQDISIELLVLNINYGDGRFGQLILHDKSEPNRDVYALLRVISSKELSQLSWGISKVGIRCIIAETELEDEHSISFELTYPNKSNLPSQHSRYQADIENVLLKAGYYKNE